MNRPAGAARQTAAGDAAAVLAGMAAGLKWEWLDADTRHASKRHLLDTLGVMIAGAQVGVVDRTERVLGGLRRNGTVPVPGRRRRADCLDVAFLGGTAAHGIEFDDGDRHGSVHPGSVVLPALLACGGRAAASGSELLSALVVGYEAVTGIARACHPELRRRGFHPTAAVGVFGAALGSGRLLGLSEDDLASAMGIAASSAGGLFAFLQGGGAEVKRLHAGQAARAGLEAALLAGAGIAGPSGILEAPDGFGRALAGVRPERFQSIASDHPPRGILDCYIKPHACCRHLQSAAEALMQVMRRDGLHAADITDIHIETYAIATAHASVLWNDFASAQLSFPYVAALAIGRGRIALNDFDEASRCDPELVRLCRCVRVSVAPELDALYPRMRPARVTVATPSGTFNCQVDEASGSPELPISDADLDAKFDRLVGPILGRGRSVELRNMLWSLESLPSIGGLLELTLPNANPDGIGSCNNGNRTR